MNKTFLLWKPVGLTPLNAINKFKKNNPEFSSEKISYAGRLDPMAEGLLLLLIGDENKNKTSYEDLNKSYESEIILGISTDSFDGLGLITKNSSREISKKEIVKCLKSFLGKQTQAYPPYSSKAVNGKSLYWWARSKRLDEIKIPKKEIEIYSIELINILEIESSEIVNAIIERIGLIKGDFRQKEIINNWKKFRSQNKNKKLIKIKIKVFCSSGTYIRRIANDIGEKLGCGAFAFSITRTQVGDYKIL